MREHRSLRRPHQPRIEPRIKPLHDRRRHAEPRAHRPQHRRLPLHPVHDHPPHQPLRLPHHRPMPRKIGRIAPPQQPPQTRQVIRHAPIRRRHHAGAPPHHVIAREQPRRMRETEMIRRMTRRVQHRERPHPVPLPKRPLDPHRLVPRPPEPHHRRPRHPREPRRPARMIGMRVRQQNPPDPPPARRHDRRQMRRIRRPRIDQRDPALILHQPAVRAPLGQWPRIARHHPPNARRLRNGHPILGQPAPPLPTLPHGATH